MDLPAAMATIDFAISKARLVLDLAKKANQLEAQAAIVELQEALLSVKEQNIDLREKIRELEEKLSLKESLWFDGEIYWRELATGEKDGPFCQVCWDSKKTLVRLQAVNNIGFDGWVCRSRDCGTSYGEVKPIPDDFPGVV